MKIAVVGSRRFNNYDLLKQVLDKHGKASLIISGGAKGADTLGQRYAKENGLIMHIRYPDYRRYGRKAPLVRNVLIALDCEEMIAFPMPNSSGTWHVIRKAKQFHKKVYIVETLDNGEIKMYNG